MSEQAEGQKRVVDAGYELLDALSALAVEDRDLAMDMAASMWRKLGDSLGVDG